MLELLHKILLGIHIPAGTLALLLFWMPVSLQKGSALHKKIGRYYYICMWTVLASAGLLCIVDTMMGAYTAALFLGYLTVITSYPLWYSAAILKQDKVWTDSYYQTRKIFLSTISVTGVVLFLMGAILFKFQNMGTVMVFFGILGILSIRELRMSKAVAEAKETRIRMHVQGTIITGIAAYTAFFAFGGSRILMGVLHLDPQWMAIPWILPSVLGTIYSRYMKRKYGEKIEQKAVQATVESVIA